jgi:uncharacterized protein (DUF697 family)
VVVALVVVVREDVVVGETAGRKVVDVVNFVVVVVGGAGVVVGARVVVGSGCGTTGLVSVFYNFKNFFQKCPKIDSKTKTHVIYNSVIAHCDEWKFSIPTSIS